MEYLLGNGLKIDAGNGTVGTALHMAAWWGAASAMTCLLSRAQPANPNAVMKQVGPVLNTAILAGNVEGVKLLIEQGAELHDESEDLPPPLTLAAMSTGEMFAAVLDAGHGKWTDTDFGMALRLAASTSNAVTVSALLQTQIQGGPEDRDDVMTEINTPNSRPTIGTEDYQSALDGASKAEDWTVVMMLLKHCKNISLSYNTAFWMSVGPILDEDRFHRLGVLDKLWSLGKESFEQKFLNNCLYAVADYQRPLAVKFLLETCGADPEAQGKE
jgi:hypothetical protein